MKTRKQRTIVSAVMTLCVVGIITAAPMVPEKRKAPDEVRCLSALTSLRIGIDEIPEWISQDERQRLLALFQTKIENQGFSVVTDGDGPRLALQYTIAMDKESVPDGVALATVVAVHQGVKVLRLDDEMTLPVASVLSTSIGKKANLRQLMERETIKVSRMFSHFTHMNE